MSGSLQDRIMCIFQTFKVSRGEIGVSRSLQMYKTDL